MVRPACAVRKDCRAISSGAYCPLLLTILSFLSLLLHRYRRLLTCRACTRARHTRRWGISDRQMAVRSLVQCQHGLCLCIRRALPCHRFGSAQCLVVLS